MRVVVSLRYSLVLPTPCVFRSGYIKWKSVLCFLNIPYYLFYTAKELHSEPLTSFNLLLSLLSFAALQDVSITFLPRPLPGLIIEEKLEWK